jgi:hypothetical protein
MRFRYQIVVALLTCVLLSNCNKRTEDRVQEETAKIAAERERLADLQQEQHEKVGADLSSWADTRKPDEPQIWSRLLPNKREAKALSLS